MRHDYGRTAYYVFDVCLGMLEIQVLACYELAIASEAKAFTVRVLCQPFHLADELLNERMCES